MEDGEAQNRSSIFHPQSSTTSLFHSKPLKRSVLFHFFEKAAVDQFVA
jgi:hypothetical protein